MISDKDGRDVSVQATSSSSRVIGIHSWQSPTSDEASKHIFLDLEDAKNLCSALLNEIDWQERPARGREFDPRANERYYQELPDDARFS